MALMYADYPHPEPIEKAVRLVMERQLPVCLSPMIICVFNALEEWFVGTGGNRRRV